MSTILKYRFVPRRRTEAEWISLNEVLLNSEIGVVTDKGTPRPFKIGDGTTPWNDLPYSSDLFAVAAGTDTITADFPVVPVLYDGMEVSIRAFGPNTGPATFEPNSLGDSPLTKKGGEDLDAGDIDAEHELTLRYVSAVPRWEIINLGGENVPVPSGTGWRHVTAGVEDPVASTPTALEVGAVPAWVSVHQVAHGFVPGNAIYYNGTQWVLADRDASLSAADAIVLFVTGADDFKYVHTPIRFSLTTAEWDAVTGDTGGLVDGEFYFLSSTAGGLTKVAPTSGIKQTMLRAQSSTVVMLMIGEPFDVTTSGGTGGGVSRSVSTIAVSTAAGAAASTDYVYIATASGITLTLPTAVGNTNSYTYKNSSAGNVNLASTSAQTFDGTASPIVLAPGQSLTLISDGTNWTIN